jgi:hypothetical protein
MKILYTGTLAISTDKLPTVGQVIPTSKRYENCFTVQDDRGELVKRVKSAVWKDMQKRYQDPKVDFF